jgi:hypothetical protein
MTTTHYGNADNLNESTTGGSGDTFVFGNGVGDSFTAIAVDGDTFIFGNGAGDSFVESGSNNDTITLGNGAGDKVTLTFGGSTVGQVGDNVTVGNGDNDQLIITNGLDNIVTVGNGNNDVVFCPIASVITVGNGNDTIHVGLNTAVTVGTGHDILAFDWNPQSSSPPLNQSIDQSKPGGIGHVTITGFNPSKDVIVLQQALENTNPLSVQDDPVTGNAVITFNGETLDTITLVGVHSSALHASDVHFV